MPAPSAGATCVANGEATKTSSSAKKLAIASPDTISAYADGGPALVAKKAGIPTMPVEAVDCPGEKLFTADMKYADDAPTVQDSFKAWGVNLADNLIALSDGKATILNTWFAAMGWLANREPSANREPAAGRDA